MAVSSTVSKYTDVLEEPSNQWLPPITGYQKEPLMSLEEAIQPIARFFNGLEANARAALRRCAKPGEDLTTDEAAAICLFTMRFEGEPSLREALNGCLRSKDRQQLKPWFAFLKLFLTALEKLPAARQTVYRGASGVDLTSEYPVGKTTIWWGVSLCATDMKKLEDDRFLGTTGVRTLFVIECHNGKSLARHADSGDWEDDVVLMPGSSFEVIAQFNPTKDLHTIYLQEIAGPANPVLNEFAFQAETLQCGANKSAFHEVGMAESKIYARPYDEYVVDPPTSEKPSECSARPRKHACQSSIQ